MFTEVEEKRRQTLWLQRLSFTLIVVICYFVASRVGAYFGLVGKSVSPVWPPAGIALSSLLIFGLSYWPAVFLAAFLANWALGVPWYVAFIFGIGNLMESYLGAYYLEKAIRVKNPFESGKDVFHFLLVPGVLGSMISATGGAVGLWVLGNFSADTTYLTAWYTWFLGDLTGIVIVTPIALAWLKPEAGFWSWRRSLELLLVLSTLIGTTYMVFSNLGLPFVHDFPFSFLVIPWLLWISLRFGVRGTAVASLAIAVVSTYGTVHGAGPFTKPSQNESLLLLQIFNIVVTMSGLVIAAVLTEKNSIFESLKSSEEKLRAIYDHSFQHVGLLTPSGTIVASSKSALAFMKQPTEIDGQHYCESPWWRLIKSDQQRNAVAEALLKAARGEFQRLEVELSGENGQSTSFDMSFKPVFGEKGNVVFIIPEARDITDLKRADEKCRTQASLLQAIIEGTTDAVYAKDLRGRYLLMNSAGAKLVGKGAEDILGKDDYDIFSADSARFIVERDRRIMMSGMEENYEETTISSGGVRTFLGSKGAFRDPQGDIAGLVGISRDITERKKMENDLRRSNSELEHFAYVASHDLQEPLRMVIAHLQLLEKRCSDKLDPDSKEFIGFAIDGARRMRDLIQDLLAYSRVARREVNFHAADCEVILSKVLFSLKELIREGGALITREPLPMVLGDSARLTQLFQNLIGNALKYRKTGITPQIKISTRHTSQGWLFSVNDNGIGIEPQFQERIFAMFQRLHSREQYPGTGIGLAICKKVVEQHGGRLWVESELGVGSTFYFILPDIALPKETNENDSEEHFHSRVGI